VLPSQCPPWEHRTGPFRQPVTTLCLRANGHAREPPAGGITAWIDFGSRTEKATFYGTIVGDRQVWPAADRVAAWLHETVLRLFSDSPYAKEHAG
jgi:hypothetical protein